MQRILATAGDPVRIGFVLFDKLDALLRDRRSVGRVPEIIPHGFRSEFTGQFGYGQGLHSPLPDFVISQCDDQRVDSRQEGKDRPLSAGWSGMRRFYG